MDTNRRASKEWLSLQEASQRVGVAPATLRAWADGGRVPSIRTPGGHRRFRLADVTALTAGPHKRESQRWQLLEHSALGRARLAVDASPEAETDWFAHFSPEARVEHRELGRKLLRMLVDGLREGKKVEESHPRNLGREYARVNRRHSIALPDALGAFIFFRSTFLDSVTEFSESVAEPSVDEILMRYRRVNALIDQVLLAMVESYFVKGRH